MLLNNRYKIIKEIGKGGSGKVLLVFDVELEKRWAIKAIRKEKYAPDRGMQILGTLDHPAIPRIVERFEDSANIYCVMDYFPGKTLAEHLKEKGLLSPEAAMRIGIEVCEILEYLHSQTPPVIFRDIKPANLILNGEGHIRIVDFDTALRSSIFLKRGKEGQIQSGEIAVTKGFSPPEQYEGKVCRESDIYALGKTLLHTGNKNAVRKLKKVIRKATSFMPERRYGSAAAMKRELKQLYFLERGRKGICLALAALLLFLIFIIQMQSVAKGAAVQTYNDALLSGDYLTAINYKPEEPENYIELLEIWEKKGETEGGISKITALMEENDLDQKAPLAAARIEFEIGLLYMEGSIYDTGFERSPEKAEIHMANAVEAGYEEGQDFLFLAGCMNAYKEDKDYKKEAESIVKITDKYNLREDGLVNGEGEDNRKVKLRMPLLLCRLLNEDRTGLSEYMEEEPMTFALNLLQKLKMRVEKTNDESLLISMKADILIRIGECYRELGDCNAAIEAYAEAAGFLTGTDKCRVLKNEASVYRELNDTESAGYLYEKAIEILTGDDAHANEEENNEMLLDIYISYANMELLEAGNVDKGSEILKKIAAIPGGAENVGYQKLRERSGTL